MKLPSPQQQQQQLESAAEIVLPQHHRSSAVLSRMLSSSSHCGDSVLPYAAAAGRRAAVLLDHRRYHHGRPSVVEVAPSCPRCDSPNTKFCYYNNYSLSQPRYFCKACRRYWTKGGSLRNVPVGGGCRKNRRSRTLRAPLHAVDAGNTAASGGGPAASSLAAAAMLRPDLLLDGMVASPAGLCRSMDDAAERPAVTSEGSTIDLALLYAKFLNQQPAPERGGAVLPEPIDTLSGSSSSDMSPVAPPRDPLPFATAAEPCAAAAPPPLCPDDGGAEAALRELGFCVGQSCYDYDSLGLPQDGGDLVLLPSAWHPGAKYEPFDALPEDAVSLQDGIGAGGDVWNTALACQGLEAALCTP